MRWKIARVMQSPRESPPQPRTFVLLDAAVVVEAEEPCEGGVFATTDTVATIAMTRTSTPRPAKIHV